jgi:signal transduction histidine kinase
MYINLALAQADTANYPEITDIYLLSSKINNSISQYEKAMEDALKALEESEHHQLIRKKAAALLCIGNIHYRMYNDNVAEQYALQAKALSEENHFETEMIQSYLLLGQIYKATNDAGAGTDRLDEAFLLFHQAVEIAEKHSDTLNIITGLLHIGDYYTTLNRFVDPNAIVKEHQLNAKKYLDKALHLALLKDAKLQLTSIRLCLIRWNNVEKNYRKGLEYALEILDNTPQTPENYSILLQTYNQIVYLYFYIGEGKEAWAFHNKFRLLMIQESDYKLHRALQEMSVKYDTQEKELEILRQQTEIDRYRTRQLVFTGGIIAAVLLLSLSAYIVMQHRRRNRLLAEMNATKDKFFSIISHDLKNPVAAQRDSLQMITDYAGKMDAGALMEHHRNSLKLANGLFDLLTNLLDWGKIQTGRMTYNPCPFNLVAVLQPDMDVIKSMAERKNIIFEALTPPAAVVTGDQNMLKTTVRNLLTNAIKFTATGGRVSLEISPSSRDVARNVSTYTISVSDTGTGMTPEQQQNLFRIDRQQTREGTAGEPSSGLGLIVCHEMLQKNRSTLHVESEAGKGSRFWFEV